MLVFIDESGDTGRKILAGSSRYFVVALTLFGDREEALACDHRISLLRQELKLPKNYEFHFSLNSDRIRKEFLKAIQPYQYTYFCVVIDKDPKKLWGSGFTTKESFYKYACQMVFTNAMPYLQNATVILDKSGSSEFRSRLANYLKRKAKDHKSDSIKKIKQEKSTSNNLIQVADYVTGIINRKVQKKKDWETYYRYIRTKEIWVQIWPK